MPREAISKTVYVTHRACRNEIDFQEQSSIKSYLQLPLTKLKEVLMKKVLLLLAVTSILMPFHSVLSQALSDYVKQVKGDTLVVKTYDDMGSKPDALYYTLLLDTVNVPAGRVYELQAGGWYPLLKTPTNSVKHPTVIVGSDPTMLVNNKNASSSPPLISGYVGVITSIGGMNVRGDLTIKNCHLIPGASNGSLGWSFFRVEADSIKLTLQNCLLEQTQHVFMIIKVSRGISRIVILSI
jgi:hypothetical protein